MRRLAPALCALAVVVPTAQAADRPDNRAVGPRSQVTHQDFWNYDSTGTKVADSSPGIRASELAQQFSGGDVSSYYTPAAIKAMGDRYNAEAALFAPLPAHVQDLEALNGAYQESTTSAVRPDDRAGIRGVEQQPQTVYVTQSQGFDWSDAGVGALGAFGACFLAGLTLLAMRRQRKVVAA
jgi:hypothetical protein